MLFSFLNRNITFNEKEEIIGQTEVLKMNVKEGANYKKIFS
jgi:hypothetical protein